jgi:hypothetical protein
MSQGSISRQTGRRSVRHERGLAPPASIRVMDVKASRNLGVGRGWITKVTADWANGGILGAWRVSLSSAVTDERFRAVKGLG